MGWVLIRAAEASLQVGRRTCVPETLPHAPFVFVQRITRLLESRLPGTPNRNYKTYKRGPNIIIKNG